MRYSRHTLLPEVGVEGQLKLLEREGPAPRRRRARLADGALPRRRRDRHARDRRRRRRRRVEPAAPGDPHDRARRRAEDRVARKTAIEALNPDVEVVEHHVRLDASNILELLETYDVVVDGADNFPTRYLLNDASVRLRKPVVSASILGFEGQISTFIPYEGPCYRCLYPTPPPPELAPSCGADGVLGVMAGVMGLLQANEVIKLVAGIGEPLIGRLLLYDSLGTRFTELKVRRDPTARSAATRRRGDPRRGDGQVPRLRALLRGPGPRAVARAGRLSDYFPLADAQRDREDPARCCARRPAARPRSGRRRDRRRGAARAGRVASRHRATSSSPTTASSTATSTST